MPFTTFSDALPFVLRWEGGYVNHPDDPGGATNKGITQKVYNDWRSKQGLASADVRLLTEDEMQASYESGYWVPPKCDVLPGPLNLVQFDTAVNMGPAVAGGFLQRTLNALNRNARDWQDIACDGRVGPATLAALDAMLATRGTHGEAVLVKAVEALQGERYLALAESRPANEAFLYGWLAHRIG